MARVAVIVPARNEAATVAATVRAARGVEGVDVVLVVDDGSSDGTGELAASAGARVLSLVRNAGKGAALEAGLDDLDERRPTMARPGEAGGAAAAASGIDAVLFLDADLGDAAAQAADLLEPVLAGVADMTVATFPPAPAGAGGFGIVKGLARWGIRTLGSRSFAATAPLSGQRALGPAALAVVRPIASGYGVEVALTVRALRQGLRVAEVSTTMSHRHSGRDAAGFAHRGRQFVDVAAALVALAFERRD